MTDAIGQALERAALLEDADAVESSLVDAFTDGLSPSLVPVLIRLLEASWHHSHENIALALQNLKDPRAISSLSNAALSTHGYLEYDEFFNLARKCIWALADMGTEGALKELHLLAQSSNPIIAGYAQKRIDKWSEERARKGA